MLRESDYFARSSEGVSRLLRVIAFGIGGIMAFGAGPVVVSVLIEALMLSLAGVIVGATVVWLGFNDASVSATSGTSPSQLTFALDVSAPVVLAGVLIACVIGMLAGLLPALRAGTVSVATAMRAL